MKCVGINFPAHTICSRNLKVGLTFAPFMKWNHMRVGSRACGIACVWDRMRVKDD